MSKRISTMQHVREYTSGQPVELWQVDGRLVVRAGGGAVEIDLYDLVHWFRDTPQTGVAAGADEMEALADDEAHS